MTDLSFHVQSWLPFLIGLSILISALGMHYYSRAEALENQARSRLQQVGNPQAYHKRQRQLLPTIELVVEDTLPGRKIRHMLDGADLHWGILTFLVIALCLLWLLFLATATIFQIKIHLNFIFSLLATTGLLLFFLKERQGKRERDLQSQVRIIADLLGNSLRSGMNIYQAFHDISEKLPSPAQDEIHKLAQQMSVTQTTDEILRDFLEQHPGENMQLLISALLIQAETGGNLVTTLSSTSAMLLDQERHSDKVQALTTESRYISMVLMIAPLGCLAMFNLLMDGAVRDMIDNTWWGFWFFLFAYVAPQAVAQIFIRWRVHNASQV